MLLNNSYCTYKIYNSKELKPIIPRLRLFGKKIPISTLLGVIIYSIGISLITYFRPISMLLLITWLSGTTLIVMLIRKINKLKIFVS